MDRKNILGAYRANQLYISYITYISVIYLSLACQAVDREEPSIMSVNIEERYQEHFSGCHGDMGQGAIAKALNRDHIKDMSEAQLFSMIYEGIGTSMPSFKDKLSSEEISGIIRLIQSF